METGSSPFTSVMAQDGPWLRVDLVPPTAAGTARLVVHGDLDRDGVSLLSDALDKLLARSTPAVVQFDFAGVAFLDSSGLRCLVECRARVERVGSVFRLTGSPPPARQVLRITDLLDYFGVDEPTGRV